MTPARVDVNMDHAAVKRLAASVGDATAHRAAGATRDRAKSNLTRAGRIRTGHLHDSITARKLEDGKYSVGSDLPYAGYQESGVGAVHARPGGVLRFQPKGSAMFIFRPRTSGFPGAHYLRDAYRSITVFDFLP
jgi:hypothetical protein